MTSLSRWLVFAVVALCAGGCTVRNPWTYNTPPTAMADDALATLDPYNRVVVVGQFENPTRTNIPWPDIGSGMSDVLTQALLNQGSYDVWSNEQLAQAVRQILDGPTQDRAKLLGGQFEVHDNIRFVIVGKVTDFHHTNDVDRNVRRWGILMSKIEAISAIQFSVVDLEARRVLVADHVFGTSKASLQPAPKIYDDIGFGSYLFWNSPLGRATEKAIEEAMERINEVVPTTVKPLRVKREIKGRKLEVAGDSTWALEAGQRFYICTHDGENDRYEAIVDPLTDLPLRARILTGGRGKAIAFLMGAKPKDVDSLVGAELRWDLPAYGDQIPYVAEEPLE